MKDSLLAKAILHFNTAVNTFRTMTDDEGYLNIVGFHLQQSVETALKYTLEKNGVEYKKTHDIESLLLEAKKEGIETYTNDYIKDHAEMLSVWEAKTRYVIGYMIEYEKIKDAISAVGEYLRKLNELFLEPDEEEAGEEKEGKQQHENDEPEL